ncbi:MAG TPA: flagellin [Bryobacteraceae bacterium]|jgi:flagellar hook-associated protein 3 FlgL|nr:flagellin [Bryobacteraceae bacterium]
MTPIGSATPGTAWFLNGLANLQQEEAQTERELSSGYQINTAADSPVETPDLVQIGSNLAAIQTYQTNVDNVQTEAGAADQALTSSITLLQNAVTLASQGASSTATAADDQTFAANVQGIQQQLVSLANTTVAGRAIFGGDQDQSAPYQYDAASATGVDSLTAQTNSRVIVNPTGQTVYQPLTAQQIFDPVDATGAPTANNTFAALQSLETALLANDQAGVGTALASLQAATTYVNQQQAYYGTTEERLTSEQNTAANQVTALQTQIGNIRDTDLAQAATDLTQESADQSAALGAEAEIPQKTLFDYLA